MLGLKLNHVSKRGHCRVGSIHIISCIIVVKCFMWVSLNMWWQLYNYEYECSTFQTGLSLSSLWGLHYLIWQGCQSHFEGSLYRKLETHYKFFSFVWSKQNFTRVPLDFQVRGPKAPISTKDDANNLWFSMVNHYSITLSIFFKILKQRHPISHPRLLSKRHNSWVCVLPCLYHH